MISRVLAGLIVAIAASVNLAAAEENAVRAGASSGTIVVAAESADEKRLEWDDADPTPDRPKPSSTNSDAPAAKADDAKPAAAPAEAARRTAPAEEAVGQSPGSPKPSAPAVAAKPEAAPAAAKDAEPAKAGGVTDVSGAKSAIRAPGAVKAPATDRSTRASSQAGTERQNEPALRARPARRGRDGVSADFAATRTTDRGRAPRGSAERVWVSPDDEPVVTRSETYGVTRGSGLRVAQAPRRPSALGAPPIAEEVAARRSTPISGGILCGGGSKWRCNWIEREHDKFYKFTKGHGWTDQTMATDFCATERQMRVASATRIKSNPGGCCGFVVVQVTCKR